MGIIVIGIFVLLAITIVIETVINHRKDDKSSKKISCDECQRDCDCKNCTVYLLSEYADDDENME